jgi:hypothetical protein
MKLVIARLPTRTVRPVFRARSQVLDQLELQLEELEAETSENAVTAEARRPASQ